ncbi:MAG: phosphoglycerate kinase [Gammaproteobacteria bacterium]|nr:phosphoglycerate kinase [Gammaproteobacteria bacterium]
MTFKRMSELALDGKRVLIREDLNVPIKAGVITSDARIRAALPTLQAALDEGAQVIVMSHLGRPQEGVFDAALSLRPIALRLSELLGEDVPLIANLEAAGSLNSRVALLENVRFLEGEKANDDDLARRLAALGEVFVMDAFATAHRVQASTVGVAGYAATACAGPLLAAELDALARALENPKRPLVVIVGGAKVSTKLAVLQTLGDIADRIIVGGGIANTFIAAKNHNVGASLFEADLVDSAKAIAENVEVPIPVDVMVGKRLVETETAVLKPIDALDDDDMILDIGAETARQWKTLLDDAGTILWNGPVGVFEIDQFGEGTRVLAEAIAASPAFSIAGGGDTLAAIDKYGVRDGMSYISTGGGAFLEFVEGKELPAVAMLRSRANG